MGIFNLFIGIYEIYCFQNRHLLKLDENMPKWNSSIIASWNEYCRVDSRYIFKHYVWIFELLNALYAFLLIFIILYYKKAIKFILLLEIVSCSLYFITLLYEYFSDETIHDTILEKSTILHRVLYYGISSIWIIVPVYLYSIF